MSMTIKHEGDNPFQGFINQITRGAKLDREQATRAFQIIMNGGATPAQIAAFLVALKMRGESVDEIAGGAIVLRAKAPKFQGVDGMMDTCGTGGDAKGTYNISTATAIVLAACGIPIAKHGNRAVSSKAGSADIFSELGLKLEAPTQVLEKSLADIGMCFLFAPQFHSAMKHVAPIRQELGMRTIFNLLGPLANPAGPKRQLLGVYDKAWCEPIAHVLKELGSEKAWVVHGSDGMDELTLCGKSHVAKLEDGQVTSLEVTPEDAGLEVVSSNALQGGTPAENAESLREILLGSKGAFRDAVLLNAAAGLMIADKASDLKEGATIAAEAIDEGKAYKILQQVIEASHG